MVYSKMVQVIPYIRNANGSFARVSDGIYDSPNAPLEPYMHEEILVGWPESKIFWAKEKGPCLGIAPVVLLSASETVIPRT